LLFIILFVSFYPRNILKDIVLKSNSEASIGYLQNLVGDYKNDKTFKLILLNKYIEVGFYDKALRFLKKINSPYLRLYYKYLIYKRLYFASKYKKKLKKKLHTLLLELYYISYYFVLHPPTREDRKFYEKEIEPRKWFKFIFKEAIEFGFFDIAKKNLKYVDDLKLKIEFSLEFKEYKKSFEYMVIYLSNHFNEKYLVELISLAYYFQNQPIPEDEKKYYFKMAYVFAKKYYKKIKTKRGYEAILSIGLKFKDKELVKYALPKVNNINLLIQAYSFLKDYLKAAEYAMKKGDCLMAGYMFNNGGYLEKALKCFLKAGINEKTESIILYLAYRLRKYDLALRIMKEKILRGDYKKLSVLTYAFLNSLKFEEAERFYWKMYRKTHNDIFLHQLFVIYYNLGEIDKLKKLAFVFKSLDLNEAVYFSDIFISDRSYKKALLIMKKSKTKNLFYYERMYFLAAQLNDKKLEEFYLKKILAFKKDAIYIGELFKLYKADNPKKAFEFLKKNYIPSEYLLYLLFDVAFELGEYNFIVSFNPRLKKLPEFYYTYLIKTYTALGRIDKIKEIYEKIFFEYPSLRDDFFWFLISHKDKDIRKYLKFIKNPQILYQAYLLLGDKKRALGILKKLAKSGDIELLINYFYSTDSKKEKYWAYRLIDEKIQQNPKLLFNKDILDFYFWASLMYKSSYEIRKLLKFIKEHKLGYKHYLCIYYDYFNMFDAMKFKCRRVN